MVTRKTPLKVLKCGLVTSQEVAILAESPDARVVDLDASAILDLPRSSVQKLNIM